MQQLVFAIQFKGTGKPVDGQPGNLKVEGQAASVSITTVINDGGITGGFDPAALATVHFESTVTMTEGGRFTEKGSIFFGENHHRLFFKSKSEGWMEPSPIEGVLHGAVVWTVEGGEGQLVGAGGIITSNFSVDGNSAIVDNQLGVIYIK